MSDYPVILFRCNNANVLIGEVEDRLADLGWLCRTLAFVRWWGTTRGVLQLVDGPLENTILDAAPALPRDELIEVPRSQVIVAVPCDRIAWTREPWLRAGKDKGSMMARGK